MRGITVDINEADAGSWNSYVASHPDCTNYHQYGWRGVIEKSFGHRTYYVVARDGHSNVIGVLPLVHMKSALFGNFLVSLPCLNYGGLLCEDADIEARLVDACGSIMAATGAGHLELRHLCDHPVVSVTKRHKVTMLLHLRKDEQEQWKAFDPKVRNQVRKAEKSGLNATIGGAELLDGFYDVFSRNMRDLGTPVYGKIFFRNVLEAFPDTTRIISVVFEGKTVASGILTWFRDCLEVPWASSIADFKEKCPNNLLYWEAIRFAIGAGAAVFDFGRSTPDEGTYRFKKQWGAQPAQLYWQYLVGNGGEVPELNPHNPKYRMAIGVWRRLPVKLTRILGPHIVRNIP
jgi:FemAB-related protein (PEP-CTERM system-associated)